MLLVIWSFTWDWRSFTDEEYCLHECIEVLVEVVLQGI